MYIYSAVLPVYYVCSCIIIAIWLVIRLFVNDRENVLNIQPSASLVCRGQENILRTLHSILQCVIFLCL